MNTWYWGLEFGKVLFGYLFFMFLWPSVVFDRYLRKKSMTFRFSFCVTVQPVIAGTVVLLLGVLHLLYSQIVALLFHSVFFTILLNRLFHEAEFPAGGSGAKLRKMARESFHTISSGVRAHPAECGVLCFLLVYAVIYFSYGAFQVHSYGSSDLYAHHAWIYGLKQGRIFSGGVYPEAMHCFVYCLNVLTGIRISSILLFLQGAHVVVFLTAGYLLLKEVFHWRYAPLLALTLFLTVNVVSMPMVTGIFRLQITLPMEFGLHTQFLCALYLLRYLKKPRLAPKKEKGRRFCLDGDLLLFAASLAASISIHFYTTIMAFVVCACFAVFRLKALFSKEKFLLLAASVLCACFVAILPMAAALLEGIRFNYSINWAVNSMQTEEQAPGEASAAEQSSRISLLHTLKEWYQKGYAAFYGAAWGTALVLVTCGTALLCLLARTAGPGWLRESCAGYPPLLLCTLLIILFCAAPELGYPEIISDRRFCSTGHLLLMALMVIPADLVLSGLTRLWGDAAVQVLSVASAAALWGLVVLTGNYHGYLFYELTRYNATVEVTNSIIENSPPKSYLIVSPTDELYPIIENAWHEELLTFVQKTDEDEGHLAALGNAFIYVEKKPLQYAQLHFFEGPSWLAEEKYFELYWAICKGVYNYTGLSQAPDINAGDVLEIDPQAELPDYKNSWQLYIRLPGRSILEAKAYYWCQNYMALHPDEMTVYYEDEDFICYHSTPGGIGSAG